MCGGSSMYLHAILANYQLTGADINLAQRANWNKLSDSQLQQELLRLKPEQHNLTDLQDRERLVRALEIALAESGATAHSSTVALEPIIMAIQWPREIRRERIKVRLQERLDAGMIEEVKSLHEQGVSWDKLSFFGLEYRFIAQYLQNELNYNDMFQKLHSAIARFAKKQDTWLRKMAREGLTLHPIEGGPEMLSQAEKILQAEAFSKS
jgi:tRNA dimethylallyltransferase